MRSRTKKILGTALVGIALSGSLYLSRQTVSVFLWKTLQFPGLALIVPPNDPAINFEIGTYYFSAAHHDLARAKYFFNRTLSEQENYPGANLQIARIAFINGEFSVAVYYADQEITYHPENATTYYLRGLVYGYAKQPALAEADFLTFLGKEPESWAGHNDLAFVYFQEGKYKAAAAIAEDGLRYSVGNPWLHNSLGVAELNLGNKTAALENFKLAKAEFENMTPGQWGNAYPGNDPQLYAGGLKSILVSIDQNIALLQATSTMHSQP